MAHVLSRRQRLVQERSILRVIRHAIHAQTVMSSSLLIIWRPTSAHEVRGSQKAEQRASHNSRRKFARRHVYWNFCSH
jgi:hypothetical protein